MKRVNEVVAADNSFFETFLDEHADLYEELFNTCNGFHIGNTAPDELDMQLIVTCGERYAAPLLVHHDMSKVVNFIVQRYGDSWKRIKAALTAEYDVLAPYKVTQTTTGEKTATNDTTSESTDKTSVVGFDSATPTDKDVDTNNHTVNAKQTDNTNTKVETAGNNGNQSNAALIASELEVRKTSFISTVINDIQTQITLDIY